MQPTEFSKCACRHCQGHIEFPAGAGGQTIACPHCGQLTDLPAVIPAAGKFPWRRGAIALLVLVTATIGLLGLKKSRMISPPETMISPATNAPVALPADEATTNGFAIAAFKLEKTAGSSLVYVTGSVRNLNAQQRFGVKIIFNLLDTNQAAVGNASDYAPTLEAHGLWKFKALVMESKAATASLNSIREDQ